MPSKPNFNFQRAERDRVKKAAKETKLQDRKAQVALRKETQANAAESADQPARDGQET